MSDTPTEIPEDERFAYPYDDLIDLDEDGENVLHDYGRPRGPVTPADVAAWEARAYPALSAQTAAAASTPVDDELPENPQNHLVEARAAIAYLQRA